MGSKDTPPLADWLALREAADFASRSERLTRQAADRLRTLVPVRVLDLGTGTGSNLRYLLEHLPRQQQWTVVDRNPAVLGHLQARTAAWAAARGYEVRGNSGGFIVAGKGRLRGSSK